MNSSSIQPWVHHTIRVLMGLSHHSCSHGFITPLMFPWVHHTIHVPMSSSSIQPWVHHTILRPWVHPPFGFMAPFMFQCVHPPFQQGFITPFIYTRVYLSTHSFTRLILAHSFIHKPS